MMVRSDYAFLFAMLAEYPASFLTSLALNRSVFSFLRMRNEPIPLLREENLLLRLTVPFP